MKKLWLFGVVLATSALSGCFYYGPCINGSGPVTREQRETGDFTAVTNTGSFDIYVSRADSFSVEVRAQENLIAIIETYVSGSTLIVETEGNSCYRSGSPVEVHVSMPQTDALSLSGSGRVFADVLSSTEVDVSNSGSGNMEIESILTEALVLDNSGSGSVEVNESYTGMLEVLQSGSGSISIVNVFEADEIAIRHSSSGRINATILDLLELDVIMSGSGKIELSGYGAYAEYSLNSSGNIDAFDMEISDVDATNSGSGNIYLWASELLDATITGSGDIVYMGSPAITSRITGSGNLRSY